MSNFQWENLFMFFTPYNNAIIIVISHMIGRLGYALDSFENDPEEI